MNYMEGAKPYYKSESYKEDNTQIPQPNYGQQRNISQRLKTEIEPKSTQSIEPYSKLFSERFYVKIFILGIIFFFAGYLFFTSMGYTIPPDRDDYENSDGFLEEDDQKRYEEDLDFYNLIKRSMTTTGNILKTAGVILLVVALFIGAVGDNKLPSYARMGMLIALGLIVGFSL